jgi:hypothetical protein
MINSKGLQEALSDSIGKRNALADELTKQNVKNTTYQEEIENLRISLQEKETKYREDMMENNKRFKETTRTLKETQDELVNQSRLHESSHFAHANQIEELKHYVTALQQNLREAQSQVKELSLQKSNLATELEETKILFDRSQAALLCKAEIRNHDEHVNIDLDKKVDYVQLSHNSMPRIRKVLTNTVTNSSTGDKQFIHVNQHQVRPRRQIDTIINHKKVKNSNQGNNLATRRSITKKALKQRRSNNKDMGSIMYTVPSIIHRDNNPEQSMVTSPSISIATIETWDVSLTKEIKEDVGMIFDQEIKRETNTLDSIQNQETTSDKQSGKEITKQIEQNDKYERSVAHEKHHSSFIYDFSDFEKESTGQIIAPTQINLSSSTRGTYHVGQEEQVRSGADVSIVEHHTPTIYDMSDFETESNADITGTQQTNPSSSTRANLGEERTERVEDTNKGRDNKNDNEHQSSTIYDISGFDTESNTDIDERKQSKSSSMGSLRTFKLSVSPKERNISSLRPISASHSPLQPDLETNSNSTTHNQSRINLNIDHKDSSMHSNVSSSNTSQFESSSSAGIEVYSYKKKNQQSDW